MLGMNNVYSQFLRCITIQIQTDENTDNDNADARQQTQIIPGRYY